METKTPLEVTNEHQLALDLFDKGQNIFITGPAGTGKSTLLKKIIEKCGDDALLQTGPTGVSALQLPNGKTLHSALKLPVGTFPPKEDLEKYYLKLWQKNERSSQSGAKPSNEWYTKIRQSNVIIIDEVSMVSRYMIESVDMALCILRECREKPFGGMQVVFVGDLMQLPSVYDKKNRDCPVTQGELAVKSPVWSSLNVQLVLLTKIFRQENEEFASLLNTIRRGDVLKGTQLTKFNQLLNRPMTVNQPPLHICYKRADVFTINSKEIEKLKKTSQKAHKYKFPYHVTSRKKEEEEEMIKMVKESLNLSHDGMEQHFLEGMRVMLTRNTTIEDVKLVNGDTGTIVGFEVPPPMEEVKVAFGAKPVTQSLTQLIINNQHTKYAGKIPAFAKTKFPIIQFDRFEEDEFQILPASYGRQEVHKETGEMFTRVEVDGIPLIPAWAITSHRSQGSTIAENIPVHINADCMQFCEGSFYVSISRCRSFDQLTITNYKGYRQSKEAAAYYKNLLALPQAKIYNMSTSSNSTMMLEAFKTPEEKKQSEKNLPPDTDPLKNSSNVVPFPSSSTTSSVSLPHAQNFSVNGNPRQWLQEQIKSGVGSQMLDEHWSKIMEPIMNQFLAHYGDVKPAKRKHCEVIERVESWVRNQKQKTEGKPLENPTNLFFDVMDLRPEDYKKPDVVPLAKSKPSQPSLSFF